MKLHTDLTADDVRAALRTAQEAGKVTTDIEFVEFGEGVSRSRRRRFEIQLGTYDKTTGPSKSRHYKNSGISGAGSIWSATYDEWGWYITVLFALDPKATFGPYKGVESFNQLTRFAYLASDLDPYVIELEPTA